MSRDDDDQPKKPSWRQRQRDAHFRKAFRGGPPPRKPTRPVKPLASMRSRVGYGWPNQRVGIAVFAQLCGFASPEQVEAYAKRGALAPLPINPGGKCWSMIAILAHRAWMASSHEADMRRRRDPDFASRLTERQTAEIIPLPRREPKPAAIHNEAA